MSLVSLKRIISDFNNLHRTDTSDWKTIAVNEWLPQALGLLGVRTNYDIAHTNKTVSDFRVELPCNKNLIIAAIYNGYRLPIKRDIPTNLLKEVGYIPFKVEYKIDIYSSIGHTSFEDGEVTFVHLDFPRDEDNVIMIPDVEQLHVALRWYLVYMMMLSQRYKHPEIKLGDAMNMWEDKAFQARNYITFPSPEQMISWATLRNNGLLYNIDNYYFD